jgi:hypothetical protein
MAEPDGKTLTQQGFIKSLKNKNLELPEDELTSIFSALNVTRKGFLEVRMFICVCLLVHALSLFLSHSIHTLSLTRHALFGAMVKS